MRHKFTPQAQVRWDAIPLMVQEQLLSKVWCSHCAVATTMLEVEGQILKGDLLLTGVCKICGGKVARVIESG